MQSCRNLELIILRVLSPKAKCGEGFYVLDTFLEEILVKPKTVNVRFKNEKKNMTCQTNNQYVYTVN